MKNFTTLCSPLPGGFDENDADADNARAAEIVNRLLAKRPDMAAKTRVKLALYGARNEAKLRLKTEEDPFLRLELNQMIELAKELDSRLDVPSETPYQGNDYEVVLPCDTGKSDMLIDVTYHQLVKLFALAEADYNRGKERCETCTPPKPETAVAYQERAEACQKMAAFLGRPTE